MDNQQQPQQPNVSVDDEVLKARYANTVSMMFTPEEFIFDFMNIFHPKGIVHSRIIMSPGHAKRLSLSLSDLIKKYEDQFKQNIKPSDAPEHRFGFDTEKAQ